jgi:hypothetical protein
MIYLKRIWNLIAMLFIVCVVSVIFPLSFIIEVFIIAPILYILKNEIYMEIYNPFSVRVMLWMKSKLMFNTNKEQE